MPACADYGSCGECANASYGCHWCSADRACHAIGSAYGCSIGASCYEEECVRSEPVASELVTPSFGDFFVLIVVLSCLLCCTGFCLNTCNSFRDATSTKTKRRDERYISMADLETAGDGTTRKVRGPSLEDLEFVPTVEHINVNPLVLTTSRIYKFCCLGCSCLVGTLAVIGFIAYPHSPNYNVCNSELDWNSLFSSLEHFSLGADYHVAVSVDNSNRFGIELSSLEAEFDYDGQTVATVSVDDVIVLPSATIIDVVVPVKFTLSSPMQAVSIYNAYTEGNLRFNMKALVKGTAAGFSSFTMNINDHVVDMSAESDTRLCKKCHES